MKEICPGVNAVNPATEQVLAIAIEGLHRQARQASEVDRQTVRWKARAG